MKRKIAFYSLIIALGCTSFPLMAQYDPQAKEILDRVNDKYNKMNAIKADFIYKLENKEAGIEEEMEGLIHIKEDRFKLELLNKIIFFDGELIREYDNDFQEYTIREYESSAEEINLSSVLGLYKNGFKYRIKEQNATGYQIELVPEDQSKSYHKIVMDINNQFDFNSFTYYEKNGNLVSTIVKSLEERPDLRLKFFNFFQANLEVIDSVDMR